MTLKIARYVVPLSILMVGVILCGWAFRNGADILDMMRHGERAEAVITKVFSKYDREHPGDIGVRFQDAQGISHTAIAPVNDDYFKRRRGDTIPILYKPDAPQKVMQDIWTSKFSPALVIPLIFGLVFLATGVMVWRYYARHSGIRPKEDIRITEAEAATLADRLNACVSDVTLRELREVQCELRRGERLLWATRPRPTAWSTASGFCVGLGLTILTTYICFAYRTLTDPQRLADVELWLDLGTQPVSFLVSESPFYLVGVYLLFSPLRYRRRLQRSLYVITNTRALVFAPRVYPAPGIIVFDWRLRSDMDIIREERSLSDRGNILFEDYEANRRPGHFGGLSFHHGFIHLGNMEQAKRELQNALDARPSKRRKR